MDYNQKPLVSILIPTYNRAHLIGETLDSVLAQTYENWECIVVDDGSTDSTAELLASYVQKDARFQYHQRPSNRLKGASSCRNFGAEKADGEYFIFLDSDDHLLKDCIKNRLLRIEEFPSCFFWIFPMLTQSREDRLPLKREIPIKVNYLEEFLSNRILWQTTATVWSKSFLLDLGGFDASYPRLNDPEIHIRAFIKADTNFKVFYSADGDYVYKQVFSKEKRISIYINYNLSLRILVKKTVPLLLLIKKDELIKLMKSFLIDYYTEAYKHNSLYRNIRLLNAFRVYDVISLKQFLRIVYYKSCFLLGLKNKSRISLSQLFYK
ncbi:glycosyltransferase family 2 protein [Leeuwenhoekiella aequorea]|uniref:Glycosyltransferase involved in cell wall biosynthesis n=1 Tax=Leeuwenhoekiella aequorea TaxID=283736 RepID=A0A4Q0PDL0_9FLAO|nr:glycosyltransferase family 2 protein [Leeuwenhoekiella aequorea]RXG24895.1 glycosyltransferase involved in cell wall biosynthesis [Leeuwenhoekiella aequorea]